MSTRYENTDYETSRTSPERDSISGGSITGRSETASAGRATSIAGANENWGSARSDYGSHAYGGRLDERGMEDNDSSQSWRMFNRRSRGRGGRSGVGLSRGAKESVNTGLILLGGIGIGAALMYFLDPDKGTRRRALVRDQFMSLGTSLRTRAPESLGAKGRDLRNRAQGLAAKTKGLFTSDDAPDSVIVERVRAELGRATRHAGAINVDVNEGRVTLRGDALQNEADSIISTVEGVRGVREVDNQLNVHERAGDIPALQGGSEQADVARA